MLYLFSNHHFYNFAFPILYTMKHKKTGGRIFQWFVAVSYKRTIWSENNTIFVEIRQFSEWEWTAYSNVMVSTISSDPASSTLLFFPSSLSRDVIICIADDTILRLLGLFSFSSLTTAHICSFFVCYIFPLDRWYYITNLWDLITLTRSVIERWERYSPPLSSGPCSANGTETYFMISITVVAASLV